MYVVSPVSGSGSGSAFFFDSVFGAGSAGVSSPREITGKKILPSSWIASTSTPAGNCATRVAVGLILPIAITLKGIKLIDFIKWVYHMNKTNIRGSKETSKPPRISRND